MAIVPDISNVEARMRALTDGNFHLTEETHAAVVVGQLELTDAIRVTRAWLASPTRILVLGGDIGVGKTVAAADAALARLSVGACRSDWEREVLWAQQHLADARWLAFQTVPTLVLENVGDYERTGQDPRIALADLMVIRAELPGARTILVVGLTPVEQWLAKADARLAHLIESDGVVHDIRGPSLRSGKLWPREE